MTTLIKCPNCGSYAVDAINSSDFRCRRCAFEFSQSHQRYEQQWSQSKISVWIISVLLYTIIMAAFFVMRLPKDIFHMSDFPLFWLVFSIIGVPAVYFVLRYVTALVLTWANYYTPQQRVYGVVGLVRGAMFPLLMFGTTQLPLLLSTFQVPILVAFLLCYLGLLFLGPKESRQGMDVITGAVVMVAIMLIAIVIIPLPSSGGNCTLPQASCRPIQTP